MYGMTQHAIYFRIANGFIVTGQGENQQTGDFIQGTLEGITKRLIDSKTQKDQNGQPLKVAVYDVDITDGGETYRLNLLGSASSTKDIIRCLANIQNPKVGTVKIRVWATPNPANSDHPYTNAAVYFNGEKVQWAPLPPVEKISLPNGSVYRDDRKAMAKIDEYVNLIAARLTSVAESAEAPVPTADDLPPMEDIDY